MRGINWKRRRHKDLEYLWVQKKGNKAAKDFHEMFHCCEMLFPWRGTDWETPHSCQQKAASAIIDWH